MTPGRAGARERILAAAYDLFAHQGIARVGVDTIIARSGVAKMSLYRHFRSKDQLILAVLERRQERWAVQGLEAEITRRERDPAARLLAIFELFDGWFQEPGFEGCPFLAILLEADQDSMVGQAAARQLAAIRTMLAKLAREAGLDETERFAQAWHILMNGSLVAAREGQREAARIAGEVGRLILAGWPRRAGSDRRDE
jgi:AcrR family transcriptional regulator